MVDVSGNEHGADTPLRFDPHTVANLSLRASLGQANVVADEVAFGHGL